MCILFEKLDNFHIVYSNNMIQINDISKGQVLTLFIQSINKLFMFKIFPSHYIIFNKRNRFVVL